MRKNRIERERERVKRKNNAYIVAGNVAIEEQKGITTEEKLKKHFKP